MIGFKGLVVVIFVFGCTVEAGKRNAQCDFVCQGKMTIECCECIGCHQGMRFGKRSSMFAPSYSVNDITHGLSRENIAAIKDSMRRLEFELMMRPNRFSRKLIY